MELNVKQNAVHCIYIEIVLPKLQEKEVFMTTLNTFTESASALQEYLITLAGRIGNDAVTRADAALKDPSVIVCFGITRDVPAVIGECFGQRPGTRYDQDKTAALLRRIGADRVYDIDSLMQTILEEDIALTRKRISSGKDLPLISGKCPAVVHFIENHFPQYQRLLSPAANVRKLFVQKCTKEMQSLGYAREKLCLILVSTCILDKEDQESGIDICLTVPELAGMYKALFDNEKESIAAWNSISEGSCDPFEGVDQGKKRSRKMHPITEEDDSDQEFGFSTMTVSSLPALQNLLRIAGDEIPANLLRCRGCIDGCVAGAGSVPLARDENYQANVDARIMLLNTDN